MPELIDIAMNAPTITFGISSLTGARIGIHGIVEFVFFVGCSSILILFLSARSTDSNIAGGVGVILICFMSLVFGSNLEEGIKGFGTAYLFGAVAIFLTAGPFLGFRISQQIILVSVLPGIFILSSYLGAKVEDFVLEAILA